MASLTIKQEKFCQLYIENCGNATDAYRGSYNTKKMSSKTINEAASRMTSNSKVNARIEELRAKSAKKHEITIEWMTEKYLETFQMACSQGKAGEAKGVLDSLGKLHGLIVDKKRIDGNINHNHKQEPVSDSIEWVAGMLGRAETRPDEESLPN